MLCIVFSEGEQHPVPSPVQQRALPEDPEAAASKPDVEHFQAVLCAGVAALWERGLARHPAPGSPDQDGKLCQERGAIWAEDIPVTR